MNKSIFALGISLGCAFTLAFLILLATFCSVKESGLTEDQRQRLGGYIGHDGWCSLYYTCKERCKCHDRCGPLCGTWRKNVVERRVCPIGYEYALKQDAVMRMLVYESLTEEEKRIYADACEEAAAEWRRGKEDVFAEPAEGGVK